jgi:hypothetical protein
MDSVGIIEDADSFIKDSLGSKAYERNICQKRGEIKAYSTWTL